MIEPAGPPGGRLGHWLREAGERINPVLLKELKQSVQARFIAGLLTIYVTFNVAILGLILLNLKPDANASMTIGRSSFFGLLLCLQLAASIIVPCFVAARMTAERSSDDLDLVLSTSISPAALIRGKLLSGMVLVTLLYSIALPFLAFTYLLRGIDLVSILIITALSFLTTAPVLQLAILIASLPVRRVLRIVLLVLAAVSLFYVLPTFTLFAAMEVVEGGVGSLVLSRSFWMVTGSTILIEVCLVAVLHAWSIVALLPRATNRAVPHRAACTGAWLLSGTILSIAAVRADPQVLLPWFFISIELLGALMLAAVSERDEPGTRVARQIPSSGALRALAFPFFTGVANGLVWCCLLSTLTIAVLVVGEWTAVWSLRRYDETVMLGTAITMQYLCYALAALLLHRWRTDTGHPVRPAWMLGVALMVGGSMLVAILEILGIGAIPGLPDLQPWKALSPFKLGDEAVRATVVYAGPLVAILLAALARRRLARQIQGFTPP